MTEIKIAFFLFSIIIAGADIKTGAVPRAAFVFAFFFFIMLKARLEEGDQTAESLAGFLAGLSVFLLVYAVSGKRLGLADVWYSALTGLVMGLRHWYEAAALASVSGILFILAAKRRWIPFIPFMALGNAAVSIINGWRL